MLVLKLLFVMVKIELEFKEMLTTFGKAKSDGLEKNMY